MSYGEFLKHAQQAGLVFAKAARATPGAPATIVVPEGQQLTVKGAAASAGAVSRVGSADTWPVAAGATIPIRAFAGTQQFQIACTAGSIDAMVGDALLSVAATVGRANTYDLIGDSITGNYKTDSSVAVRNINPWGVIAWWLKYIGQNAMIITSPARGGSGVTANFAGVSFDAQVETSLASVARKVTYCGGTNDVFNNVPNSTIKAKMIEHWTRLNAAGKEIIVWTQPVANSTATGYTASKRAALIELNEWLKQVGRGEVESARFTNFRVADVASATVDPLSTVGNMRTNGAWPSDGLHNTNVTAQLGGKCLALTTDTTPAKISLVSSAADNYGYTTLSRNLFDNALLINSASGLGSGLSIGYTTAGQFATPAVVTTPPSAVASIVADPAGVGFAQRLDCTFVTTGDRILLRTTTSSAGGGNESDKIRARIVDGDSITVSCKISARNITNLRNIEVFWWMNGNATQKLSTDGIDNSLYSFALSEGFEGLIYKTLPIKYDAATMGPLNLVQMTMIITAADAGAAQVEISQWTPTKVVI